MDEKTFQSFGDFLKQVKSKKIDNKQEFDDSIDKCLKIAKKHKKTRLKN
jgi:hypothetical protein